MLYYIPAISPPYKYLSSSISKRFGSFRYTLKILPPPEKSNPSSPTIFSALPNLSLSHSTACKSMASSSGAKSRQPATSLPSRGRISSPLAFASSSMAFLSRPSSSPKPMSMYGKPSSSSLSSAAAPSVRFQNDQKRSASPGRPISVQKNRDKTANVVSSNKKKACMCSPTTHPGSFRCALHKNSKHSVNVAHNRSHFQNGSLNDFRRSAMTNSLVRIGGVEGGDLVRRALSALIRPSSNQQRRRSAFQPRPSRLSVMSRAEEED